MHNTYISENWPGILFVIGGILLSMGAGVCWGKWIYKKWLKEYQAGLPVVHCAFCGGVIGKREKVMVLDGRIVHSVVNCVWGMAKVNKSRYRDKSAMTLQEAVKPCLPPL